MDNLISDKDIADRVSQSEGFTKHTRIISKKSKNPRFHISNSQSIVSLEKLEPLATCDEHNLESLLLQKIGQCCAIFDFLDISADISSKEVKSEALGEILNFFSSPRKIFNEAIARNLIEMVRVNLFRTIAPLINPTGDKYDPEEDEPVLEPSWTHIQIVYEIFLQFLESPDFNATTCKAFIDQGFVINVQAANF